MENEDICTLYPHLEDDLLEVSSGTSQSDKNEDILKIKRDHMCMFVPQSKDEVKNNVTNSISLSKNICIGSFEECTQGIAKKHLTKM